MLDLQHVVRGALDVLCDLMAVRRAEEEGAQDEHIKGALEEFGLCGVFRRHDSRDSTS
jgi:hypothetical protein